jgi:hypothetical protein
LERCKEWRAKSHRERLTVRLVHIAFGNCDLLSTGVTLLKSHLEREREMPSLWVTECRVL